jgi:F-type H+-transporting ATPase subunit delta
MSVETVARRYATALADVVSKTGDVATVRNELKTWEEMIAGNPDLRSAFSNPAIQHLDKEAVLNSLIAKTNPSRTTANFLRILLKNDRLVDLKEINVKFDSVLEERSGTVAARVTSARDLSEEEKAALRANIERLTGRQVNLSYEINEAIIGGVVTRVGSTVYDSSIKTQLENLRQELIGS